MRDYAKLIAGNTPIEEVMQALRDDGLNKIQSIKMLSDLGVAKLGEAKRLVHFSRTWADRKANDEAIWDEHESLSRDVESGSG